MTRSIKLCVILMCELIAGSFFASSSRAANSSVSQAQQQNKNEKKFLVAFFSRTGENYAVGNIKKGNTHIIAEMIAAQTHGQLFEIKTVTPYPDDYQACTAVAKREKADRARPSLQADVAAEDYDVVFIGYPNWWGDMPMAVYSFIEKHNWNGKTVIPFCTHEGSGLSGTEGALKESCKGAVILPGFAIKGSSAQNAQKKSEQSVWSWIKELGF